MGKNPIYWILGLALPIVLIILGLQWAGAWSLGSTWTKWLGWLVLIAGIVSLFTYFAGKKAK